MMGYGLRPVNSRGTSPLPHFFYYKIGLSIILNTVQTMRVNKTFHKFMDCCAGKALGRSSRFCPRMYRVGRCIALTFTTKKSQINFKFMTFFITHWRTEIPGQSKSEEIQRERRRIPHLVARNKVK